MRRPQVLRSTKGKIGMGTGARFVAVIATVALVVAGCASSSASPVPSVWASPAGSLSGGSVPGGSLDPSVPSASVIVMADGVQGGIGLWRFQVPDKWTVVGATPGATSMAPTADGVVIVAGRYVEVRSSSDLTRAATTISLEWPTAASSDPVVAVDRAPDGKLALVTSDGSNADYAVATAAGTVTVLQPAPTESFTPLIAWLDDTRLLVLSTDRQQVSRLAVIDTAAATMTPITTIGGIDFFAVSADRMTLVASTEGDIFVAPVSEWIAGAQPQKIGSVVASSVIWGLALDKSGTHLAMLSGTVSADGRVGNIREVGYAKGGSTWVQSFDAPAPITTARAQAWVS